MHLIKKYILFSVLVTLNFLGISAQDEMRDSLRASLVTCTPGTDVYAHFGHTALRLYNFANGKDVVFNYGCFDASGSDFVIKFIKGETDYVVDAEPADYFFGRYDYMGNGVSEQVLNLTQAECQKLAELLFTNLLPENRGYRYNWLYDNCTTRARDMINKAIDGTVQYNSELADQTARNELHECLQNNSWLKLGIDLLLGTEIDTTATRKVQQFIPKNYENDLASATIKNADGTTRPMVLDTISILEEKEQNKVSDTPFTPIIAFSLLTVITLAISIWDYKRKRISIWYDFILHTAQGIAGIIIAYLFFFSLHPAVDSNWQVILFNPLFLIYAGYILYCNTKNKKDKFIYVISAVYLLFFMTISIAGQSINAAVYLMVFTLCIRTATRLEISKKTK